MEVDRTHEAAVAAQEAAERSCELVEDLHEFLSHLREPAELEMLALDATTPIKRSEWAAGSTRSFGVINPNAVTLYLGIGGARAAPNSRALSIGPSSAIILPVYVEDVNVGADPVALGVNTAVLFVLRFKTVQPFFLGAL